MAAEGKKPVGLAVKLPFQTRQEFIEKYRGSVSLGGIFLRSNAVRPPGTEVTLDLKLANGERLIYASAVVHYVTGQKGRGIPGVGLRFVTLDPESRKFLESIPTPAGAKSDGPPLPAGVGDPDYDVPRADVPAPAVAPKSRPSEPPRPTPTLAAPSEAPALSAPPFEEPKEEPKRSGPIIGIDLGTTNSCAAFVRNGKPIVLASREGYNTVPSIIALNARGKLVVGHPAKGQMLTNPRLTVYGSKRFVGRPYESLAVQEMKDRFHYEIAPGPNGETAVKLGDRIYSLQQIAALILREVKDVAQNQLGQPVSRAVITVPAYYNENQRQAVRDAGRLAGFYVERILNEPTAAALAYAFGRKLKERVLVYDLGGGTFDASILELHDNVYEVLSTGGDTFLGGIDFDNAIVSFLLEEFKKTHGREFVGDRVALQRISDAAERAKCTLSERNDVRVHVPFATMIDNMPYDIDVTLTREKLVELTQSLVEKTIRTCDEVIKAKSLRLKDIDEVILVGGQSRFPEVHTKITNFFQRPPHKGVHPDEAVALGAALFAYSLGQMEGVVLIDVLPMSIGVQLPGGRFKSVIERNSTLPATKSYTLTNNRDDQRELELAIYQGDADSAQRNEYIGTVTLSDLPKGPKGSLQVSVTFDVSPECLLKVTAKEGSSGKEVVATFNTKGAQPPPEAEPPKADAPVTTAARPGAAPEAPRPARKGKGLWAWLSRLFVAERPN